MMCVILLCLIIGSSFCNVLGIEGNEVFYDKPFEETYANKESGLTNFRIKKQSKEYKKDAHSLEDLKIKGKVENQSNLDLKAHDQPYQPCSFICKLINGNRRDNKKSITPNAQKPCSTSDDAISYLINGNGSELKLPGGLTLVQQGSGSSINIFFGTVYSNSKESVDQGM